MSVTHMDRDQIIKAQHDEKNSAQRVTIIGGDFGLAQAVRDGLKDIKIEAIQPEKEIVYVDRHVIVKEVKDMDKLIKLLLIMQTVSVIVILIRSLS